MFDISFEWKINFAIVVSLFSLLVSIIRWRVDKREKAKAERKRVYEEICDDANFILGSPLRKRDRLAWTAKYVNKNPEIQRAVRKYLDSHWMDQYWSSSKFIPSTLKNERQKIEFIQLVHEEAERFRDKVYTEMLKLSVPELSPVFYLNEPELNERLNRIISHVGRNYSSFTEEIRRSWEMANIKDPLQVKNEYKKSLRVCENYFDHNKRDFDDPFYDIVKLICKEYRNITRSKKERIQQLTWNLKRLVKV